MLVAKHKLKRDYKITWTEYQHPEDTSFNVVHTKVIKNCYNQFEAYELWYAGLEYDYDDFEIDAVELTHQDLVNLAVYDIVLATLFDSDFGVYQDVDLTEEDLLITELPTGLEKMLVEHQAQLKFDRLCKSSV